VTITQGTNTLLGEDPTPIVDIRPGAAERAPAEIDGWDGRAGERVAAVLASLQDRPLAAVQA
jgi:hypothetical protein